MTTMTALRAIESDGELLLEPTAMSGSVHSVFSAVVNIEPARGDLWCLAARSVSPGPRTVLIDVPSFDAFVLRPGAAVSASGAKICLGGLEIAWEGATLWHPRSIDGSVRRDRVVHLAEIIDRTGVTDTSAMGDLVRARIDAALADIGVAVRRGSLADATAAARSIVGLGAGLTPAGDDVLTGLAYAAATLGGALLPICRAVAAAATSEATNAISLTALRSACRGRAHDGLAKLLGSLTGEGTRHDLEKAAARLAAIGHTSGTDQMIGLIAAVRLHDEMRGK